MAVAKKNNPLANAFKDEDAGLEPVAGPEQRAGNGRRLITEGEALVAANLPAHYSRTIAMMAAEEGVMKKALVKEALDLLFAARGRKPVKAAGAKA